MGHEYMATTLKGRSDHTLRPLNQCSLACWQPERSGQRRLRVFDLPADVLDSQGLGDATESALSGIAAAADSAAPPVYVQARSQHPSPIPLPDTNTLSMRKAAPSAMSLVG